MTLAFTFLAPVAGIIAAGISVPLLALLYFLKLRRRPLRVSSTLLWDASAADLQVNVPFRWIRPSWLLLLQSILLALLALAMARPSLEGGQAPTGRIAILIDHSASMSAVDASRAGHPDPVSRLDAAKAAAIEYVNRLDSGAQAIVVAFAARPEALTSLSRDRGLLRQAIRSIEPTDQPGDLAAALRVIGAALRSSDEETDPGRVLLLSDGGEDTSTQVGPTGLGRARVDFVRMGPPEASGKDNLGIVAMAAKRDYEDPATVRLFVRVQNAAPRILETSLTVRVAGEVVSAERLVVPAASINDGPGETALTVEFLRAESALVTASIARVDSLQADNTAALVLAPPAAPRILLVQPNVRSRVVDLLALDALASIGPGALDTMTSGEFEQVQRDGGLAPRFDLVVLDRVTPTALPALPTISFGASLPIAGLRVERLSENDTRGASTDIAFWRRMHPVMRYVSLSALRIDRPMLLTLPDAEGVETRAMKIVELASGKSSPLIALIEDRGVRRVIVAFELADSHWWRDASFPVFIKNCVDYLTLSGDDRAGRAWGADENVVVRADAQANRLVISGPMNLTREIDEGELAAGGGRISLGALRLAGVYSVDGAEEPEQLLAINLASPKESSILTRDSISIGSGSTRASALGATAPREIWHWFVLAALVLLTIEWWVFAQRMRL